MIIFNPNFYFSVQSNNLFDRNQVKNYYNILQVSPEATQDELKQSYRKLSKVYHPDLHEGNQACEERFKEINEAYQTLSDKSKRQAYDERCESYTRQTNYTQTTTRYTPPTARQPTYHQSQSAYYGLSYWLVCLLIGIVFKIVFFSDKPSLSQSEVLQRLQTFQAQNTPLYTVDSIIQASYRVQSDSAMRRVKQTLDSLSKFELNKYSSHGLYSKDTTLADKGVKAYPQLLSKPKMPLRQEFTDSLAWRQELRLWQIAYLLWKQDSVRWRDAQKVPSDK